MNFLCAKNILHRPATGKAHAKSADRRQALCGDGIYQPGRLKADGKRTLKATRYCIKNQFHLDQKAVEAAREEAGCFVLLSNTLSEGEGSIPAKDLPRIYKDQHMVERNLPYTVTGRVQDCA